MKNHNFDAFAQDVIHLLENHELARNLGNEAWKFVASKYSWKQVAENVESVYYELLDRDGTWKGRFIPLKYFPLHRTSIDPCYIGKDAVFLTSDYFSKFTTGRI
jgi:hypothetical protein